MESSYGIAVNNKYALFLDDDEDPFEILKAQEEAQLKKKEDKTKKDAKNEKAKSAGKNKANKKPVTLVAESKPKTIDQNANRRDADRNRGKPKQDRERDFEKRPLKEGNREIPPRRQEQRGERTDRPERSQNEFSTDFREGGGFSEGRGRGRGDRGNRRGGRGRGRGGFDRFGKREFERHSGSDKTGPFSSGIKPVEKREGGGAHNWGTIKDDLEDQLNETQTSEEGNPDWAGPASQETENRDPNTSAEGEGESPKKEEEEPEMTLDEWKAMQQGARAAPKFNIRKAGEGVDEGQWKKTYELKKKADEVEEESEEESEEEDESHARRLNIEITFNDNPRRGGRGGRRGRGGRGGGEFGEGRGGRGRGGDFGAPREFGEGPRGRGGRGGFPGRGRGGERGDRHSARKEAAPNPEDESEFPTLK